MKCRLAVLIGVVHNSSTSQATFLCGSLLSWCFAEGKLVTVFSAPDYPQFQPSQEDRFYNLGAVAVLRGSHDNYASPEMIEYSAAPRPPVSHPSYMCAAQPWRYYVAFDGHWQMSLDICRQAVVTLRYVRKRNVGLLESASRMMQMCQTSGQTNTKLQYHLLRLQHQTFWLVQFGLPIVAAQSPRSEVTTSNIPQPRCCLQQHNHPY